MAWRSVGKKRVYRRTERKGGKFRTVYFGSGAAAQLAADLDIHRRAQRQERAAARKAAEAGWAIFTAQERELDQILFLFVRASLTAAGYRQHNHGAWRKWRLSDVEKDAA